MAPTSMKVGGRPERSFARGADSWPLTLSVLGGSAVEGTVLIADWVPGGITAQGRAFAARYRKATGKEADNWAALGHSFMTVVAHAIKTASPNPTREKVRDALAKTKNVPVVAGAGNYTFDENRLPRYGAAFLVVKGGEFVGAPQ